MNEISKSIRLKIRLLGIDNETGSGFMNADVEKMNKEFMQDLKEIQELVVVKRAELMAH